MSKEQSDTILENLRTVLAGSTGVARERIQLSSRLEQDLGITGDDLVEAVDAVFEKFGIDPGDFEYKHYGSPEGLSLFGSAGKLKPKPLTVGMLAQAIRDGHWSSAKLDGLAGSS